jgi:penicillin amidase
MTATGKPLLANDPHRPVLIPSLRKTVHLVGPGWNAFGAGEPALPGIALGHNEHLGFGFTIVGIDQQDLYVEKLNPNNADEYRYRGAWKKMEIERQPIHVKGRPEPHMAELRHTVHGPVIHEDRSRHRAYALRWVGMEPGTAGYLAGLAVARARTWNEFLAAMERYKVPGENIIYADTDGNIGWQAIGLAPIRKNWSGLFPVPGDSGEYEWTGFRKAADLPRLFNPSTHAVATANHNILPTGYQIPIGYEWAMPFRYLRAQQMLDAGRKFTIADFERMQQDVTSVPARRFQEILRKWGAQTDVVQEMLGWDGRLTVDSRPALIYEVWISKLPEAVLGSDLGERVDLMMLLQILEAEPNPKALAASLETALTQIAKELGPDRKEWKWGRLHQIHFRHPLDKASFHRGPKRKPSRSWTWTLSGFGKPKPAGSSATLNGYGRAS